MKPVTSVETPTTTKKVRKLVVNEDGYWGISLSLSFTL
jgi:hypothetical protein